MKLMSSDPSPSSRLAIPAEAFLAFFITSAYFFLNMLSFNRNSPRMDPVNPGMTCTMLFHFIAEFVMSSPSNPSPLEMALKIFPSLY